MYKTQKAKEEKVSYILVEFSWSQYSLVSCAVLDCITMYIQCTCACVQTECMYNNYLLKEFLSSTTMEQEEQRKQAKRNREELRKVMEEHEEVHSEIRWRRVCALFEDHPLWKLVNPEERKDVFEDVVFALSKKEKVGVAYMYM